MHSRFQKSISDLSVFKTKDHLGNIRLSYTDRSDVIIDDDFSSDKAGWIPNGGVSTELLSGRIKVTVDNSYEGIRNALSGFTTSPGKKYKIRCVFDKGNTNSDVRLYIQELTPDGTHLAWVGLNYDLQTGTHEFSYTVQQGARLYLRLDKDNTNTTQSTYFYLDKISMVEESMEILEENNYYPFGLKHKGYNSGVSSIGNSTAQKFKYNGKELSEELGLNTVLTSN